MNQRIALAAGAVALGLVAAWPVWRHEAPAPRESRPAIAAVHPGNAHAAAHPQPSSHPALFSRLLNGELPKMESGQIRAFVERKGHSAASLLAAWHLGNDNTWLDEAASRYPDDPRVALAKLTTLDGKPEEANEWIERLQRNAPENAMGWCYAALQAAKENRQEDAKEALADAAARRSLDSYGKESAYEMADAWRGAGYNSLDAETLGRVMVPLPECTLVMNLVRTVLANGPPDPDLIDDLMNLGTMVRGQGGNTPLVSQLVGSAAERKVLEQMNTLELVPGSDLPVVERLAQLDAEKALVRETVQQATPLIPTLNESEFKQYLRRSSVEGELKALQWVIHLKKAR